ncbi:hypothetical protein LB543_09535 [Mesorhizobium sp. ESP7-2]|nr:hypothetical protein [Mesorhizobium sp. ESP7-2]
MSFRDAHSSPWDGHCNRAVPSLVMANGDLKVISSAPEFQDDQMKTYTLEVRVDPRSPEQELALIEAMRHMAKQFETVSLAFDPQPRIALYISDMFAGVEEVDLTDEGSSTKSWPDRKLAPPTDDLTRRLEEIRSRYGNMMPYEAYLRDMESIPFTSDDRIHFNRELEELCCTISGFATRADGSDISVAVALASGSEQPIALGNLAAKSDVEMVLSEISPGYSIEPNDQLLRYSTKGADWPGFGMESGYAVVRGDVVVKLIPRWIT